MTELYLKAAGNMGGKLRRRWEINVSNDHISKENASRKCPLV